MNFKRESLYQAYLIGKLNELFPGCLVLKNDSGYKQGIPDLSIFYWEHWAMLEVKLSENEPFQPNQEYYIEMLDKFSFARVIYPSNEEEVLYALQLAFESHRHPRVP